LQWIGNCRYNFGVESSLRKGGLSAQGRYSLEDFIEARDGLLRELGNCWAACSSLRSDLESLSFAVNILFTNRLVYLLSLRQWCPDSNSSCFSRIDGIYTEAVSNFSASLRFYQAVPVHQLDRAVAIPALVAGLLVVLAAGIFLIVFVWNRLWEKSVVFLCLICDLLCTGVVLLAFGAAGYVGYTVDQSQSFLLIVPFTVSVLLTLALLLFLFNFVRAIHSEVLVIKRPFFKHLLMISFLFCAISVVAMAIYFSWLNTTIALPPIGAVLFKLKVDGGFALMNQHFQNQNHVAVGRAALGMVQLCIALVFLVYAVAVLRKVQRNQEYSEFQVMTLVRVVIVACVLILAFAVGFCFQMLDQPSFTVIAPEWVAVLGATTIPVIVASFAILFFIGNAMFSSTYERSQIKKPLLEESSLEDSSIPQIYRI
jgi:hypothetical protein